ncbi:Multidrug resistance protein MdtN [Aquisphaera giovannonii]|uniref:Multidrug resistance protein MdtN n=1 Tax=Aquisphaera giovannonii TaxID=406548 RepID=A0A5B9W1W9_9BACT|nr:efflux RND transporter periplasmic adaptor subunit [Aquisphaera giovannonii]QEH34224.1 Multidrug resistance protein MdtN [Aquisphaera giovannonii]
MSIHPSASPDVSRPDEGPGAARALAWWKRALGIPRRLVRVAVRNSWFSFVMIVAAVMGAAILVTIVLPGYTWSSSRLYTSKFGYSSLLRKLKRPFPVTAARIARRTLDHKALGEGLVRSEPTVVSIVPMGTVVRVHVRQGDRVKKGQLVAEIDPTKINIKVESARAALQTARAELERVKIGSAYVLTYERPRLDQIREENARKQADLQKQLIEMNLPLLKKGYASKAEILLRQIDLAKSELAQEEAKFNLTMSSRGVKESITIAESAVKEAELALSHRLAELKDYKVYSIADGLVERCLVHEGEYNQDPGKPAFLIASDAWFEGNFDQGAYDRIRVGSEVKVRLEAYPDRFFPGKVTWINPFVNYDLGGPESTRPIRPMGTGAPEWPATFAARVRIEPQACPIIPGMTGFCVVLSRSEVPCLPRESVASITAGKGIVYAIRGDRFEPREVTIGVVDGDWIEIRDGLGASDEVIRDGYQVLMPDDKIRVVSDPGGGR